MEIYDEEDRGEREDMRRSRTSYCSRIGQTYNFTIRSRCVLKYGPHFGCLGCKYIAGEVASQSGHGKECKIRITVEMENKHRAREWYVAKRNRRKERSASRIMMKKGQAKEERQESKSQEQPVKKTCVCPTPVAAAATWQCDDFRRYMMTHKVVQESKGPM